ncbi:MAG TPA: O-antigen ligase family protein, partial [Thermoanaerobaculia bacterium]|nr:O-antigen ligase family protein [Thermoanaerobaculia bacterium]
MLGLLPPALLLLFGAWCGTFAGSASFAGSTVGAAAMLGMVAAFGAIRRFFLASALWAAAAISAWSSPVPRASWMVLLLLPAFLLLPGAVARCWSRERDRRIGLRALATVTLGVSLWALIDYSVRDLPRVAMPLGQHNLLAAWLVILLPFSLLVAREPGLWRWMGLASVLLSAATILATRSLAGNVALAGEALLALVWFGRSRRSWKLALVVVAAGLGLFSQRARIAGLLTGQDLSFQGRAVYWEGAWEGFLARPLLGWGPGSAAWTASAFFDPVPGVTPWGESIFELHSLPLHLAYELGTLGLAASLGLAGAFAVRRFAELRSAEDPTFAFAGLCGLLG